jgi:hypothetical protein
MKFLRALAVLAICMGVASAQVSPVVPNGTVMGNSSGVAGPAVPLTTLPSGLLTAPGAIGGTTPGTGTFTSLSASGTVSGSGFSGYLSTYLAAPAAIGGTTPAAATFSTLASTQAANLANGLTQAANTIVTGLSLIDSTAASSGNTQYSPQYVMCGTRFVSSASQPVCWAEYVLPATSGASSSFLVFGSNTNGGSYSYNMSFNSLGTFSGASFQVNIGGTNPGNCGNCLYYATTNTPAISAGSTEVESFTSTLTTSYVPLITGTTPFTVSGCGTAGSVSGTGTTGTFTVGTGASTCTFIFTINGSTGMTAVHGWIANVDDLTKNTHCTNTSGGSTTTAEVLCNFVVATSDIITFHADPY